MARNINDRLSQLSSRRKGTDRLSRLTEDSRSEILAKAYTVEEYEKRATKPHTRYALGAMEEVGPSYTAISLDTAERVGKQLQTKLTIPVAFRIQGSVRLNVHIRAVSDVDLLTLDSRLVSYDSSGCLSHTYTTTHLRTLSALQELRKEEERILRAAYPAATVDCSGGKAISLSGGSLPRQVDVVPSVWSDNCEYQKTQQEHDRGVFILNKNIPETIENLPFLHIKRVHDRDGTALGGLKKAIRLVKSVKNDSDNGSAADLSSFDIAALLYHADTSALSMSAFFDLAALAEAQRFFDWCHNNKERAAALTTPDGTRKVLNTAQKLAAMSVISVELDDLAREVAKEQAPALAGTFPSLQQARDSIRTVSIPRPTF